MCFTARSLPQRVSRHARQIALCLAVGYAPLAPLTWAQPEAIPANDDPLADLDFEPGALDDLSFDDSLFADETLFDAESDTAPTFRDAFRYQLTQQWVGHLNRHRLHAVSASQGASAEMAGHQPHQTEVNRLAGHLRYQDAFANGWLAQASAWGRLYLNSDYEHDNPDRSNTEWRLNEFFLQHSGEHNSITGGRQTVVWGETIGLSVLDVVNTTEYRDLTVIDLEDARLNQWMLSWDHFSENGNISSFINVYPEFNPLPIDGSPLFPGAPLRLSSFHRDKAIFEVGTRWQQHFTGSDLSLMAARLYENNLLHLPDTETPGQSQPVVNDYLLLGGSINRAIDTLLLTLDVAWSRQVQVAAVTPQVPDGLPPDEQKGKVPPLGEPQLPANMASLHRQYADLAGVSAGLEYAITPLRQLSVGLRAEQLLNLPGGDVVIVDDREDIRADILLRYSHVVWQEVLSLAITAQADLAGNASLLNLSAEYQWNDNVMTTAQLIATRGDPGTNFGFLDEDLRLGLTMTLSF